MSAHPSLSITPLSCLTAPQPGSHATAPASLPPCNTQSHRPDALAPLLQAVQQPPSISSSVWILYCPAS